MGWLLISLSANAEEVPRWLDNRAEAAQQARKEGKLLVVVELSGDFARNAADARELQLYRSLAAADPRIAAEFRSRYVVARQHVGEAESLRKLPTAPSRSKAAAAERTDYAITYICLPDERVLHFVPGFVTSDELLAELAWAEKCYAKVAAVASAGEELAARQAHQAAAAKSDLALFHKRFPSRWSGEALAEGPSTVDLPMGLVAARDTVADSLAQRLGGSWSRRDLPALLAALSAHGALGREIAHLLLAEFPLVALGDVERPAFEACSGQRFWEASSRREKLAQWWKESRAGGKPVLLVVADDPHAVAAASASAFMWPPENTELVPQLPLFASELVSIDELAALATDASLPAMTYRAGQAPPRYLVFSADGKPAVHLGKSTNLTRLSQALEAATGAGALATVASKREGESDADED
ncbi:MAG TPA: hypothetical protein VFV87_11675 [Pirellulaceae bacterium]|nr:hypothetical protein [Pirellulaceae bacterium]